MNTPLFIIWLGVIALLIAGSVRDDLPGWVQHTCQVVLVIGGVCGILSFVHLL
jgi:hypothetical protein